MAKSLGYLFAVLIGISLGLIGGGGSILAVPILVYVMGVDPKVAIATSLVIVGTVSLIGAIPHGLKGNVNLKAFASFTPPAMVGAYLGARLATLPFIADALQLTSFGVIMLLASALMIRQSGKRAVPNNAVKLSDRTPSDAAHQSWPIILFAGGLGVGILTGFVGVGGGFLIIPTLVLLAGIPMKEAVGTSLLIISANSAAGFIGYMGQVNVNWILIFFFTLAASIGSFLGSHLTQFVNGHYLQRGFGYFVLVIAAFILIRQ